MRITAVFGGEGTPFTVNGIAQFVPKTQFVLIRGEAVVDGDVAAVVIRGPVDEDSRDAQFAKIESGLRVAGLVAGVLGSHSAQRGISAVSHVINTVKG